MHQKKQRFKAPPTISQGSTPEIMIVVQSMAAFPRLLYFVDKFPQSRIQRIRSLLYTLSCVTFGLSLLSDIQIPVF
jgi:hypothetical protein